MVLLEQVSAIDFTFRGLDRLDPPIHRSADPASEDLFCKQLLKLGAKWCDNEARYGFVKSLDDLDPLEINDLLEDGPLTPRSLPPTMRERRWVKVGWPSEPPGALWVAEADRDTSRLGYLVPEQVARVMLAKDMDERCEILKMRLGARYFRSVDDYEGYAFLKTWEDGSEGEVGRLMNYHKYFTPHARHLGI